VLSPVNFSFIGKLVQGFTIFIKKVEPTGYSLLKDWQPNLELQSRVDSHLLQINVSVSACNHKHL